MDKIIILGVGNSLKRDDWIGCYATKVLKKDIKRKNILFITGSVSPEAWAVKIAKKKPKKVIILDAVDMGLRPGDIRIIKPKEVSQTMPTSHKPSLKIMIDYLQKNTGASIEIIGIQPKDVSFGEEMSKEVKDAIPTIKEKVQKLIQ